MAFLNETGLTTLWNKIKQTFANKSTFENFQTTINASLNSHIGAKNNPHGVTAEQVGAYTTDEVDDMIASAISSTYKVKGSVDNYSSLPTNAEVGDVYNVVDEYGDYPAGTNWVWVGATDTEEAHWDALGGTVDLSDYYTKTEVDSKITASKVTVDSALSSTSTNPVQNKVINTALAGKLSTTGTAARATADANGKNIATTYAPLSSPQFIGTPLAPTAASGTNTTQIATTAFVQTAISGKVDTTTFDAVKTKVDGIAEGAQVNVIESIKDYDNNVLPISNKVVTLPDYALSSEIPTIPASLKNPYKLTFTGGVTGDYDGSAAKSVAIPIIDSATSTTSTNGLQNKVITTALNTKEVMINKKSAIDSTNKSSTTNYPSISAVVAYVADQLSAYTPTENIEVIPDSYINALS